MAGTVCGPQFSGKNCDCYLQVTAGTTPATGQASNPLRICSFVSSDGTLLACDPGCCKTDCSLAPEEKNTSSSASAVASSPTSVWWIIVLTVLFGLLIGTSYVYRVVSRNSGSRRMYIAFAALVIIAMIIVAAVGATEKKKGA